MTDPQLERDPNLKAIVERLVAAFLPEKIYLFGSKARGEEGPDSDYDLMVIVRETSEPGYRLAQRAHRVVWGLPSSADILVWTVDDFDSRLPLQASLPATILREGKLLYAA